MTKMTTDGKVKKRGPGRPRKYEGEPKSLIKPLPSNDKISEALIEHRGNISAVAKALGFSRSFIYRRIKHSDDLIDTLEEAREMNLDELEGTMYERAKAGSDHLLIFALKTAGRSRGFGDRAQVDVNANVRTKAKSELSAAKEAEHLAEVFRELERLQSGGEEEAE